MAGRLAERARQLLPLATALEDEHVPAPEEEAALAELAERLQNTYPYPDPRYAGQMLKPPAAIAWAAYATAMLLNPNNHALDGGPATAEMEREAVAQLAGMFGLPRHLGHLTASGTIANLEALWVARELHPDRAIVSGANAHYTHARVSAVLGARHETVPEDARGRIDLDALAARLRAGGVGTVVATPGTTGLGAIDDVAAIADLCEAHGARLHVDAAYGGFFALIADDDDAAPAVAAAPFAAIARADSVVIDPHKHGLQPYGCGCVLFADPGVGRLYAHDSPYTYFTSDRAPPGRDQPRVLARRRRRRRAVDDAARAAADPRRPRPPSRRGARRRAGRPPRRSPPTPAPRCCVEPETDIVCVLPAEGSAAAISAASERAFDSLAEDGWHVAKLRVATDWLRRTHPGVAADAPAATVLRCCLLKQEHAAIAGDLAAALAGHLDAARTPA